MVRPVLVHNAHSKSILRGRGAAEKSTNTVSEEPKAQLTAGSSDQDGAPKTDGEKLNKKIRQKHRRRLETDNTDHLLPVRVAGHRWRQQQQQQQLWPIEPQLSCPPTRPGAGSRPLC